MKPMTARERLAAAKPNFDKEHCDECHVLVTRGTLKPTLVGAGTDLSDWRFLCVRCLRLREEAA